MTETNHSTISRSPGQGVSFQMHCSRGIRRYIKRHLSMIAAVLFLSVLCLTFIVSPEEPRKLGAVSSGRSNGNKLPHEGYLMLLTHESRLRNLVSLEMSFRRVGTTRPRIVAVTENILPDTVQVLEALGLYIVKLRTITRFPKHMKPREPKWLDSLYRFEFWLFERNVDYAKIGGTIGEKLPGSSVRWDPKSPIHGAPRKTVATEDPRYVSIDIDTMIIQNMDELFDRQKYPLEFYYNPDNWECGWQQDKVNGGLLVFTPSHKRYNAIWEMMDARTYDIDQADQEVLTDYWKQWEGYKLDLPEIYLAFAFRCKCSELRGGNPQQVDMMQWKGVHFAGRVPPHDSLYADTLDEYREYSIQQGDVVGTCIEPLHFQSRLYYFEGIAFLNQTYNTRLNQSVKEHMDNIIRQTQEPWHEVFTRISGPWYDHLAEVRDKLDSVPENHRKPVRIYLDSVLGPKP